MIYTGEIFLPSNWLDERFRAWADVNIIGSYFIKWKYGWYWEYGFDNKADYTLFLLTYS